VLTRNTWFRWVYGGDWFTTADVSPTALVKVVPLVRQTVTRSGSARVVSGTATRSRGTAVLSRVVGSRLVRLATTHLTSNGRFSFGRRRLAKGRYRVDVSADVSWAAGAVRFTI
jgi:hypothetical protein